MKKYKNGLIMVCAFIIISILLYTIAHSYGMNINEENGIPLQLYFLNPVTNKLEMEEWLVEDGLTSTQLINTVIEGLSTGPRTKQLLKTIPDDIVILSGKNIIDEGILELVFSSGYKNLTPSQELYCRSSLVWSLTSIDGIDNIRFFIEQEELLAQSGQPIGLLNKQNTVIDVNISPDNEEARTITLYFTNEDRTGLLTEKRSIYVNPMQDLEKYVIEELLKGPQNEDLFPTLSSDAKISFSLKDGSICYVDLSQDSLTRITDSPYAELAVYSIVNSLCELPRIKKVQILVDSDRIQGFNETIDLSVPLDPNESIVLSAESE